MANKNIFASEAESKEKEQSKIFQETKTASLFLYELPKSLLEYGNAASFKDVNGIEAIFLYNNGTAGDDIFQSGIVVFPAIYAVEGDGAQTISPIAIALYLLGATVSIGYRQSETKSRWTVTDKQFPVTASLFIVEAVAQKHLQMVVGTAVQTFSDVEGVEKDRFVIVAPRGGEIIVAHLFAIHGKMIKA